MPVRDEAVEDIMMRNQELIMENQKLRDELTERIHMCDMRSERILELTTERDEARREVCQIKGTVRWNHYFPHFDPKGYAENRGWDCHKDYK